MRSKRPFRPSYHPQAGRRAAAQRRREVPEAEERLAAQARYHEDQWRQRMMAKLEPERYLRMVDQELLAPYYSDIARAAIARRA